MTDLWTTLVPLAFVTAVLPVQVAITIVMLRGPGGRARAAGWIAGMTVVRVAQYAVLFLVLEPATDDGAQGPSVAEGALLLVVAVLLLVSAARKVANQPDEDAPSPRWMTRAAGLTTARAFLAGASLVALSPKLWAFTLGAIGAIGDADLGVVAGWAAFLVFVALAQSLHLAALGMAVLAPDRADAVLDRLGDALERHSRPVMIVVSAAFGGWFLLKSLRAFGIL